MLDKIKEHLPFLIFTFLLITYMAPLCVVWIFDVLQQTIHSVDWYLNPLNIYFTIFSMQKYVVVTFCFIMYLVFLITKKLGVLKNQNEHGAEHWASKSEISRIFKMRILSPKGLNRKNISCGGMVIKKVGNRIWHECTALHSLIIGTTSSGKTRKTLIPSIMVATESAAKFHYKLKVIIKTKHDYELYQDRQTYKNEFACLGFFPFVIWQKIILGLKKKLNLREKIVVSVNEKFDIKKYYHYEEIEDVDFYYKCKSKNITVSEDGFIETDQAGICRINISISINGESFFVNDPKRELYKKFKIYLEQKGYNVVLLDLRNNLVGDCWNPIATVVRLLKEGKRDEADLYANDIAAALCPESKLSEKIWNDGERAVIAAVILAVADADCDENMKNMYSCYLILLTLGQPREDETVPLNDYLNGLPIGNIARTAFGPAALATDRTRMSFFVSAAATLHMFSNVSVAKQTARSTFDSSKFSNQKTAVFLVCPDEKLNMNPLASLFIDECYRVLTSVANKTQGSLYRRFHFFVDEFSNLNEINGFSQKLTISRGRNIIWHLYVQDYSMVEKTYGREVLNTIKANCNLTIYISTQSFETAEDISKRIGNRTIITQSISVNSGNSALIDEHGSMTKSLMGQPLMDANKLMQLPDGKAIVLRMRCHPIYTTIPDCSSYEFFNGLIDTMNLTERDDPDLVAYIPSGYLMNENMESDINSILSKKI